MTERAKLTTEEVFDAIRPVTDPEIRIGIVDLGLIYDVELANEGRDVTVKMTLTSPMCPVGPMIMTAVHENVALLPGVGNVSVELVWDPPWDPRIMASDEAKDQLGIW
jgi:metal-sulfur cluster biosynthetic enzyme